MDPDPDADPDPSIFIVDLPRCQQKTVEIKVTIFA
jgi:hypothetical protein